MKKLATLLVSMTLLMGVYFVIAPSPVVLGHHCFGHGSGSGETASGDIKECLDAGACIDTEGKSAECVNPDTLGTNVNTTIQTVVNFLSFIVGFIAVIMIIIGGLKYITSAGDSNGVSSAKNTILYAIIGLVIVALAQIIVRFVLNNV